MTSILLKVIFMKVLVSPQKYDRRRKYYMVLDCETATLPIASELTAEQRKAVAIAKPLIYDLGWTIVDKLGRIYARKNFLISEIFSVPEVFDTAYYAWKRPIYLDKLSKGEIKLTTWSEATAELEKDLEAVEAVSAYNAMFDFKKALPFTELYISKLYSPDFYDWLHWQNKLCQTIAHTGKQKENSEFDGENFRFRSKVYPMFDLWALSCRHILNCDEYKEMCLRNEWETASGKFFKTSAETTYRFITGNMEFDEAHTAIDDADIETEIFALIAKRTKGKWEMGLVYFPFRELGTVEAFNCSHDWLP